MRIAWGIVAPNGKAAMMRHAREFAAQDIPFIFDPGQGLPMFDGEELRGLIGMATALTVNDYEAKLLSDRTGWSEEDIAAKLKALVITRGAEGFMGSVFGRKKARRPEPAGGRHGAVTQSGTRSGMTMSADRR